MKNLFKGEEKMSQQDIYESLCKNCYIKIQKPSKKDIKKIVMSEYKERCENCGKVTEIVEYIED